MEVLHERVKQARTAKGYSQKRMAELLGISQPGYQQIESGKYPDMKTSTLVKLCEYLDVSADWILGFTDKTTNELLTLFYMEVIDLIVEYGDNELIEDNIAYKLTREINRIRNKIDNEF